jgi:hypothetical protein
LGIKKAILNTVHAFTASQTLVDAPSKREPRMGRSAAINLASASTGAARAITKALPEYEGRFDGIAIRTPVAIGSISDITFIAERPTTPEEINQIFEEESATDRYKFIVAVTRDPFVSSDIIRSPFAAVIDLEMTRVVDGDLVKVMAWYDNEWGFTNQMIRQLNAYSCEYGSAGNLRQQPLTLREKIVSDTELFYLGTNDFIKLVKLQRKEYKALNGEKVSKGEWRKKVIRLLKSYQYYTGYCRFLLHEKKYKNLLKLKRKDSKKSLRLDNVTQPKLQDKYVPREKYRTG